MRSVLLVLLFVAGCQCNEVQLQQVSECGKPCFVGKQEQAGIGVCNFGTWYCIEGEDPICMDQGYPLYLDGEACNGLDDDCDGQVDEGVRPQPCATECGSGISTCFGGTWTECNSPRPTPEVCDGLDNDCDGQFDEDIDTVEFCYEGGDPLETRYGACRPGVRRCMFGVNVCSNQVTPTPESCNGIDDDCDGQVDEGFASGREIDIVFVVDNSCSMAPTLEAVAQASTSFANNYAALPIRWALVVAPGPAEDPNNAQEGVQLFLNFTTPGAFASAMMQQIGKGSGYEPTLDAIDDITNMSNPLGLDWRPGSRHVMVMFTDEEPQSFRMVMFDVAQASLAIQLSQTRTFVFTSTSYGFAWQNAMPAAYGTVGYLSTNANVMEMALRNIVEEVSCQ